AALGGLLDLHHPWLERVRGPPRGRGILVGERELDLLPSGRRGCRERRGDQAGEGQAAPLVDCVGHVLAPVRLRVRSSRNMRAPAAIVPPRPPLDKPT